MYKIFLSSFLVFAINFMQPSFAQEMDSLSFYKQLPFYKSQEQIKWVDSTYNSLSLDEKLGQLFMVAAYSNQGEAHENSIRNLIQNQAIGGLIFMQDDASKQVRLTNEYQKLSKTPLLIGMDAEWGVGMRLKNINNLPWAMTLGALEDDSLVYDYGVEIARQMKRLGAHLNFGPVVDVNTNPDNPIIGNRSFGSDVQNVANKGIAYTNGMQDQGILGCAKHFPGHGDTSSDSHKTLPTVDHKLNRLEQVELEPFKQLVNKGVASVMIAHLNVPALESNNGLPSSLSPNIVTKILKEKLGFKGLIVTDALNMKGVTNAYPNGETDLRAFEAGNDILLFSQAVDVAKSKLKAALESGRIPMARVEESVKKILMAKYATGLNKFVPIKESNVMEDLNNQKPELLNLKIAERAISLIKNEGELVPFLDVYEKKIAYVKFGDDDASVFYQELKKYASVELVSIAGQNDLAKLDKYDQVIIGFHKTSSSPFKSYKPSSLDESLIPLVAKKKPSVLCVFASPYAIKHIKTESIKAIMVAYQNTKETQLKLPNALFGANSIRGKLPVDINENFKANLGVKKPAQDVLGYALAEEVNMSTALLAKIDTKANDAISKGVSPGMQILVARHGKVVYEKAFGKPTYESSESIDTDYIYDLASVTKVIGTLPMVMKAVGEKKISINQQLGEVLPKARETNKSNLVLKDILGHQAGLTPWIGFYKETVDIRNAKPYLDYFSRQPNDSFSIEITDRLYLLNSFKDSIEHTVYTSPVGKKEYKYSDLSFYILKDVVEHHYNKRIDSLAEANFFRPMGMYRTAYNPLKRFQKSEIAPTERDRIFRNELVHGRVHDQGAILTDGVGGHAGLFSNARDLAKIMYMFSNGGYYAGKKLLESDVLNDFTSYHFLRNNSRRGLGFDKEQLGKSGPTCGCTSEKSFGHQGFTGTMVWADPEYDIIYIFLSNRIYPSVDNEKINTYSVRSKIQSLIYAAITD